jgi:hypothetical protein
MVERETNDDGAPAESATDDEDAAWTLEDWHEAIRQSRSRQKWCPSLWELIDLPFPSAARFQISLSFITFQALSRGGLHDLPEQSASFSLRE